MARKTANTSGLLSASIWEASILATAPAPTGTQTTVTTTGIFTATFTAPNTTNKTTGVWLYWNTQPSTDKTITLQEATVDTACTVTVPAASIVAGWNYIRFPTPYQWTATTAGRYRFKIVSATSNDSALASASSLAIYMDTYDSVGTLGTSDDAWIGGLIGATTTQVNIEVSGTSNTCGSGAEKTPNSVSATGRTGSAGLYIANGGRLWSDGTVANTLQVRGYFIVGNGGELDRPAHTTDFTIVTKTIFDCETANGNYYFGTQTGAVVDLSGAVSDTPYAEYVSGTGTSGSHFTVDRDTDWIVGMELLIEGDAYNQIEKKFIKTVYNAREFQLADTAGGAESALSNTHTATSTVAMITRNQLFEQTNSTRGSYFYNTITTRANCNFNWARWNDMSFASGVGGFSLRPQSALTNYDGTSDYMVFNGGNSNRNGWTSITTSSSGTDTGIVFYLSPSSNAGSGAATLGSISGRLTNQTFEDFLFFNCVGQVMIASSAFNNTFNNCRFMGNNTGNNAAGHAVAFINSGVNTFNNCRFNTTRGRAVYSNGAVNTVFNECKFADIGTNEIDVYPVSDTFNTIVFNSCTFGSATLISNYAAMLEGSRIGFHRYQDTDRRHRAFQPNTEIYSTGSGLTDTNADTTFDADSLAMKMLPLNATIYGTYNFYMPQRAGNTIIFSGKLYKTAAFNGDCIVNLYLDGETVPNDSYTLTGSDSTWIPFVLSADYTTGIYDRNTRIEIKVRGTAGQIYLDTLFNSAKATNPIGSLDLWQDGTPNEYLVSTVASASEIAGAVWSDNSAYGSGTKGQIQSDTGLPILLIKDKLS